MKGDHTIRKEDVRYLSVIVTQTIPGTPPYSRKDKEYGAGGIGVPG